MASNKVAAVRTTTRCAIYTRKSTEEGLEQEFNSLDAHAKLARPISSANATKAGARFPSSMMMVAIPAGRWSGRR